MSIERLIQALRLPPDSLVNQRVPKKLLNENDAPTPADKRMINDGIEEIYWIAALKPTIIGVPEFRNEEREYLEIAVLTAVFRPQAKTARLTELIHRAIPYPVVLVSAQGAKLEMSLAHKRFSQAEEGKAVIEAVVTASDLTFDETSQVVAAFLATLSLSEQTSINMYTLYHGWVEKIEALAAARITGRYAGSGLGDSAATRRVALNEHARLLREIAGLRAKIVKEKQLNRRVELNMKIKNLENKLQEVEKDL